MKAKDQSKAEDRFSRFVARNEVFVIREADMACATCAHRIGLPSECAEYKLKPAGVMRGDSDCPDYVGDAAEKVKPQE